jgi:hypothetical protein
MVRFCFSTDQEVMPTLIPVGAISNGMNQSMWPMKVLPVIARLGYQSIQVGISLDFSTASFQINQMKHSSQPNSYKCYYRLEHQAKP